MNIYNIEFTYTKKYTPIKVQFLEKRFPTYIEFLLYSILLNYPDRKKSLSDILKDDFNIVKQDLFEKALDDLLLIKCVRTEIGDYSFSQNLFNVQISNLSVPEEIRKSIENGEFGKSVIQKTELFKLYFDNFQDTWEVNKENNWPKRISGSKYNYSITTHNNKYKLDYEKIKENCLRLLANDNDNFSPSDIVGFFIDGKEWDGNNSIEPVFNNEQIAFEIFISFNEEENKIQIICENEKIEKKINSNNDLKKKLFIEILSNYTTHTREKLLPLDLHNSDTVIANATSVGLFSEIQTKSTYDLCLLNGRYINVFKKLIEDKKLFSNIKYLIVYNSKVNTRKIDRFNNIIIFYTNQLSNNDLLNSSFTFIDLLESTTYYLANKSIFKNVKIPYLYNKKNVIINLKEIYNQEKEHFENQFDNILKENRINELNDILEVLTRIGVKEKFEDKIYSFINDNILNPNVYNEIVEKFDKGSQISKKIFEKMLIKCIYDLSEIKTAEDIVKLLLSYKISSINKFIKLLEDLNYHWNWKSLMSIIGYLEKADIDPWSIDCLNCVEIMLEHYWKNQKIGLFSEIDHKSHIWKNHAVMLNTYSLVMKTIYQNNFIDCWKNYNDLVDQVMATINQSIENIKDRKRYITIVGQYLNSFYEYYNSEKNINNIANLIGEEQFEIRILRSKKADEYLNQIDFILNNFLTTDEEKKLPTELKYEYIVNVLNIDNEEIEKINYSFPNLVKALKVKYGKV
ncbi:hypothetical protein [Spiroplasma endosymbiont of Aspidapion aeneum]|uniref:hypothetical protein n=1 Tax=Spiroplasma endosymbiont of Aspidapion aeneum TaxID=3066276 RepID=UPI00313E75F8